MKVGIYIEALTAALNNLQMNAQDHFAEVKAAEPPGTPHRELMRILSSQYQSRRMAQLPPVVQSPTAGGS